MAADNRESMKTAFTVSIEAAEGVTTGISAADRSRTVQAAVAAHAARDLHRVEAENTSLARRLEVRLGAAD